jgi:hypothetical protein
MVSLLPESSAKLEFKKGMVRRVRGHFKEAIKISLAFTIWDILNVRGKIVSKDPVHLGR